MAETAQVSSGPVVLKDNGYRQRIIKLNALLYIREDTGPNLEEATLCLEDDEPDTHELARFTSLKTMQTFIEAWNITHTYAAAIKA